MTIPAKQPTKHVFLRSCVPSLEQVINEVGAFNLKATLNCEAFATEHSSTAHFDVKSFVGLAWRPAGEPICCGEFDPTLNIDFSPVLTLSLCCVRRDLRHWSCKPTGFSGRAPASGQYVAHVPRAASLLLLVQASGDGPRGSQKRTPPFRRQRSAPSPRHATATHAPLDRGTKQPEGPSGRCCASCTSPRGRCVGRMGRRSRRRGCGQCRGAGVRRRPRRERRRSGPHGNGTVNTTQITRASPCIDSGSVPWNVVRC